MENKYLITGGAGFIGSNYAHRLLARGEDVTIFDNLSRRGAEKNIAWLRKEFGEKSFQLIKGDVRDSVALDQAAKGKQVIVHLAAQVAVTTSVTDPREDFEINAAGTFNLLEAARKNGELPVVLYSSTNKVYGGMEDVAVREEATRYAYVDYPLGIDEKYPVDFHSPYGCSKGCGDQYMRDYQRIYGIRSVVFRQSCIYGPRQFGVEDQGWLAWFVIAATQGRPITIYGDGKQVRDVLFVGDLLNAYDSAVRRIDQGAGEIFNVGGGQVNTISVWKEFAPLLEEKLGKAISTTSSTWRPGDQKIYVSDIRKAQDRLNWLPEVGVEEGISRLVEWVAHMDD
jgi:CDP-paratose 2-epimerase